MKKKYTVAILGCGGRGLCYGGFLTKKQEEFEIVAMCDINHEQIKKMYSVLELPEIQEFYSEEEFFEKKRADLVVIATGDRDHVRQSVKALELGYDILLEKPVSDSREELDELLEAQQRTGGKIMICHVLRYGGGYRKCEELIKNGAIGRLYAIDASERVAYWHWAQAYVRGDFAKYEYSHPSILAKCSHDLDLIQNYADSECDTLSSIGDLTFFKEENAPEGAADRCVRCKHIDTCPYSAKRIYIDKWHEDGEPEFVWPFSKVSIVNPHTEENLYKGIAEGPFGRCAFKCDAEMVDHQYVQMTFKNGIKASLKMIFSAIPGRRISFYGTLGEIVMDERTDEITVLPYGGKEEVIKIGTLTEGGYGHGGGDSKLVESLYGMLSGDAECTTSLKKSIECHLMGIAAEESRKSGGALVKVHKD